MTSRSSASRPRQFSPMVRPFTVFASSRILPALMSSLTTAGDVGGQGSRAWGLDLWRGWLQSNRRAWGIGAGRQGCQEGDRRNS